MVTDAELDNAASASGEMLTLAVIDWDALCDWLCDWLELTDWERVGVGVHVWDKVVDRLELTDCDGDDVASGDSPLLEVIDCDALCDWLGDADKLEVPDWLRVEFWLMDCDWLAEALDEIDRLGVLDSAAPSDKDWLGVPCCVAEGVSVKDGVRVDVGDEVEDGV